MDKFQKRTFFSLLLCLGIAQFSWGQILSGNVTDEQDVPLPGANVIIKETNTGVSSDFDGNFQITVEKGQILQISFIGYITQEVLYTGQDQINIKLLSDNQLEEVVVTALGFKESRDKQGSTSSIISAQKVVNAGEATLANSLSGKASGLRISRSNGDPGAASTIRIRGANTIDGDSDPLIIVDGVPLNSDANYSGGNGITGGRTGGVSQNSRFDDINPNDIESIQILKGASAAALWGSRAANGVIVITTKSGSKGQAKITFKSTYSFDEVSERIPMQSTWGQGTNGKYNPAGVESWGDYIPDRSGAADEVNTSGQYFESYLGQRFYPVTQKNSRETFVDSNWDAVFQTGTFFQNDFTISGGGEKNTYFFSLSNIGQEGIIRNTAYDRTNARLNYSAQLNEYIDFSAKSTYSYVYSNRAQQNSNTTGVMLGLLRTAPDFDARHYIGNYYSNSGQEFTRRQRSYRRYLGNNANPTYNNPLWAVYEQVSDSKVNRYTFTPQLTISPSEWLQFIARANVDTNEDKRVYFFPVGSAGDRVNGILQEDNIGNRDLNLDLIGKADFSLTDDINLSTTLGWSVNDRQYKRISGRITGFLVNSTKETTSLNTAAEASSYENFRTFRSSNRGYGILNFDFFDELFLNVSGGLEASSTIKGTFFYPAGDLAWNFIKKGESNVFSFAKMRASWGKVGVQPGVHKFETLAEGSFNYSTYSDLLNVDLFGGGFRLDNNLGNPDLKPEIKTEWEIGGDFRFLNDDLTFGFTYYDNKIEGILLDVTLSPSSGFATQYGNFGSMKNNGFEMDLGWNIIDKPDFSFNTSLNWSTNENEVTDLYGTDSIDLTGLSVSSRAIVGKPLGVLYGTGAQTNADGSYKLNENGFPQITSSPIVLGDPNADWRAGLSLDVRWKKFFLRTVIEHSQGGDFAPRTLYVLRRFGTTEETANRLTLSQDLVNYAGKVIPAGTTVRGNIEDFGNGNVLLDESWYRTGIGGGLGDNQLYNLSIYDATFTKVRELSLTYNLDSPRLNTATGLSNILFTLSGRNLININKVPGIDPETNITGVGNGFGLDYFTNPQTKSFLVTVSFNY